MSITVIHQSIEPNLNWLKPINIQNPRTLVLGSFNPFKDRNSSVGYFYGRRKNHFWKTIARINDLDEDYFYDSITRKAEIMDDRFCCLDVIDYIDFNSDNPKLLNRYLDNKIFANFLDQNIWTTKTKFNNIGYVNLSRTYNQAIITTIQNTLSIEKVIHTMGNNRINLTSVTPKEKKLQDLGFEGFINTITTTCRQRNIEFVYDSYSPSDYAIKNGQTTKQDLENFLREHLWF